MQALMARLKVLREQDSPVTVVEQDEEPWDPLKD